MEIVDRPCSRYLLQLFLKIDNVHMRRCAFEKNIDGIPNQYPGAAENEDADNGADNRIRHLVATEHDGHTGNDSPQRTHGVTQDVKERSAYIEALGAVSEQQVGAEDICG